MKLAKTSVQPIDLDELARQLQEVALSSLPRKAGIEKTASTVQDSSAAAPESGAEPHDGEATTIRQTAARDNALRSIAGGLAHMPRPATRRSAAPESLVTRQGDRSAAQPDLTSADIEAAIERALRSDPELNAWRGEPQSPSVYRTELEEAGSAGAAAKRADLSDPEVGGLAGEGVTHWTEGHEEFLEPSAAPSTLPLAARRGAVSPHALALSAALFLIALGVGGAIAMRMLHFGSLTGASASKTDEMPADLREATLAGGTDDASPAGAPAAADPQRKPDGVASAAPDASTSSPAPSAAPAAAGGAASPSPGPSGPADAPMNAASAPSFAPAPLPAALAPATAPATGAAQPAAQDSASAQRVAAAPVNGGSADAAQPTDVAPMSGSPAAPADAAADAPDVVAPLPPQRPTELQRPKPSRALAEERKPTRPAAKPVANGTGPDQASAPATEPQPTGLPGFLHQVFGGPHAAPANTVLGDAAHPADASRGAAVAARTPAQPTAQGGVTSIARTTAPESPSVSVKLASSTSEEKARETLARLQKQFPDALSGGSVRREDLGKLGVFYRVRVGPLPRESADKVCAQLKAGGASCAISGG